MPALTSEVDTTTAAFQENAQAMCALIDKFRAIEQRIRATSARAKARFDARD